MSTRVTRQLGCDSTSKIWRLPDQLVQNRSIAQDASQEHASCRHVSRFCQKSMGISQSQHASPFSLKFTLSHPVIQKRPNQLNAKRVCELPYRGKLSGGVKTGESSNESAVAGSVFNTLKEAVDAGAVQAVGGLQVLDGDMCVPNETSWKKVIKSGPEWAEAVHSVAGMYQQVFGDRLVSVFVRGSVPRGLAIPGVSDLDMLAYVLGNPPNPAASTVLEDAPGEPDWAAEIHHFKAEATQRFAFATGVEMRVVVLDPWSDAGAVVSDALCNPALPINPNAASFSPLTPPSNGPHNAQLTLSTAEPHRSSGEDSSSNTAKLFDAANSSSYSSRPTPTVSLASWMSLKEHTDPPPAHAGNLPVNFPFAFVVKTQSLRVWGVDLQALLPRGAARAESRALPALRDALKQAISYGQECQEVGDQEAAGAVYKWALKRCIRAGFECAMEDKGWTVYTRDLYWCCHVAAKHRPALEPNLVRALLLCLQERAKVAASQNEVERLFQVFGTAFSPPKLAPTVSSLDAESSGRAPKGRRDERLSQTQLGLINPKSEERADPLGRNRRKETASRNDSGPVERSDSSGNGRQKEPVRMGAPSKRPESSRWKDALCHVALTWLGRSDLEGGCAAAGLPKFRGTIRGAVAECEWGDSRAREAGRRAVSLILSGSREARPVVLRGAGSAHPAVCKWKIDFLAANSDLRGLVRVSPDHNFMYCEESHVDVRSGHVAAPSRTVGMSVQEFALRSQAHLPLWAKALCRDYFWRQERYYMQAFLPEALLRDLNRDLPPFATAAGPTAQSQSASNTVDRRNECATDDRANTVKQRNSFGGQQGALAEFSDHVASIGHREQEVDCDVSNGRQQSDDEVSSKHAHSDQRGTFRGYDNMPCEKNLRCEDDQPQTRGKDGLEIGDVSGGGRGVQRATRVKDGLGAGDVSVGGPGNQPQTRVKDGLGLGDVSESAPGNTSGGSCDVSEGGTWQLSQEPRLWMSPRGAVSPLHFDVSPSCLLQVRGSKRMLLYDSRDLAALYPHPNDHPLRRRARVDPTAPDLSTFPAFANVAAVEAILHPGDVIFFPSRWAHYTESLDFSMSVSCRFFEGPR